MNGTPAGCPGGAEIRTRFAPSPTGYLHLGHAFSALTARERAKEAGGTFLVRIEDIDLPRCRPAFEAAIYEDLGWLGIDWPLPVMRQSDRMAAYDGALARLAELGVLYPCSCTRGDIKAALSAPQEGDPAPAGPDGPVYPGTCRGRDMATRQPGDAVRIDMARAMALAGPLTFDETGPLHAGRHAVSAEHMVQQVGDIVLARKDIGTSYHMAVVVDDSEQRITEVVRGADLFSATRVQVLLQALLGLPHPAYHHHRLIRDDEGRRLAKRADDRAIRSYRDDGMTPDEVRALVGL